MDIMPDIMQTEENALERALRLAANEPAHRPDFYTALLSASVFVFAPLSQVIEGPRALVQGENITITHWSKKDGTRIIPFFSSLIALQRAAEGEYRYLALPARVLFKMTKGHALLFNPKSPYGKEFSAREIASLLSNGVNCLPQERVTKKAAETFLSQPEEYPSKMVDSLTTLMAKRGDVKSAYLLQLHEPSNDPKPHLVVGIELEGNVQQLMLEIGVVAGDSIPPGKPLDLMRIIPGEKGLSEYFLKEVQPFYERRWGAKLQDTLGFGRA